MNTYQMMICPEDKRNAGYIEGVQTMEITENGDYSFRPGDGYQGLAGVDVSVEIDKRIKMVDGMKLGYSSVIDTSKYDWSDVEDFSNMFRNYSGYDVINLTDVVTSKATDTSYMFSNSSNIFAFNNELDKMDTSNVTNMAGMFNSMQNLVGLVIYFDTSNVTNMKSMFKDCNNMLEINVTKLDTSKVTNMDYLFLACRGLTHLDVSNFNTSNVTSMIAMFQFCTGLTSLDLSNFDTSKVTNIDYMFNNCLALTSLDLSNFTITQNPYSLIFYLCNALRTVKVTNCDRNTKEIILTHLYEDITGSEWAFNDEQTIITRTN